jgi:hypothetical protein
MIGAVTTAFTSFDVLIERLAADGVAFGLLQGHQSPILFGDSAQRRRCHAGPRPTVGYD